MKRVLPQSLLEPLADVKERLQKRFGARFISLTLFGSQAWGEPDDDSDIDLFVVIEAPLTHHERAEAIETVAEVSIDRQLPLSPLVFSSEEMKYSLEVEHALVEDIVRKGIPL